MNGLLKRMMLLLVLVLAVVGCVSAPPAIAIDSAIIGKWGIPDPSGKAGLRAMLEFQADGTFFMGSTTGHFEASQGKGSYWPEMSPTYKTKFTYTITGSDMRFIMGVIVLDVTKMP